ncbi:MAG: hypothetical protein H0T79_20500 [Deltaproteobacteria bacterium]|nr:hypothetical protein [Deltaproteobacteria bacterium]
MRIFRGSLVAVLALSALSASACKKAEDKKDPTAAKVEEKKADVGSAGSAAVAVTKAADPAPVAMSQATGDDLSLLPANSEIVLGINFQQLQASPLWKQFVEPQMMKDMSKIEEFKAKCGFNPLESVQTISMGMTNVGGSTKPDVSMVVHGLDKTKMSACFDKMKDEAAAKGSEITKDGDVVLVKNAEGMAAMTFVNDTTMIISAPNGSKDSLMKMAKGDSALKSSQQFVDMFSKINAHDTIWGLANGSSKAFAMAANAGMKFKAVYGSVNVTDGLALDVRARMDSADQATSLVTMAKGKADQVKGMVDKLDITNDGADVKVNVAMSQEKLKALAGLAMSGMGGGGMGAP